MIVPATIADAGDSATRRFLEFFVATVQEHPDGLLSGGAALLRLERAPPARRPGRLKLTRLRGVLAGLADYGSVAAMWPSVS
jgi:hypothetical protein